MSFLIHQETFYQFAKEREQEHTEFKRSATIFDHKWLYQREDLQHVMSQFQEEEFAIARLAEMGGIQGLAYALRTNTTTGLGDDELQTDEALDLRRQVFGRNEITRKPPTPIWEIAWDILKDPVLRILILAGIISIIIGAAQHAEDHGWIEGLAVLLAVFIVVLVGSINNYQKERQFRAMEAESEKKYCIVLRGGKELQIPFSDVVVGDLVVLRAGYSIPCDGVFVLGTEKMKTDESGLTGESRTIEKNVEHPLFMKGTQVVEGDGLILSLSVGDHTEWGQLMSKLTEERDDTPLQEKLEKLASYIGWIGFGAAALLFVILIVRWAITGHEDAARNIVNFVIMSITIIVVAVPEGLPLAVTLSLAYSMKKMIFDNNFVRHIDACETMGNATTICSDKTGTLTQNIMSVTKVFMARTKYFSEMPSKDSMSEKLFNLVTLSLICNSKAFYGEAKDGRKPRLVGGNQTECAMLQWALDLGADDYKKIRTEFPVTKFFPFDSAVKSSSVLVKAKEHDQYYVFTKGAAEQIMDWCSTYADEKGESQAFTEEIKSEILSVMDTLMNNGLRCLAVLYKMINKSEIQFEMDGTVKEEGTEHFFKGMTWLCVCGIQDPVRPEVPDAVRVCQNAGIIVRMVTGDNIGTAKHIARQCGILTKKDHVCMTGGEFRQLTDVEKNQLLPKLRVLARSKPTDKESLVQWYKEKNGDVVAVTGDGANDALALTKADVGLAMGIQGTDVAKEASDIVIMDDNFASIVKTVMWGRAVYDNIRKFVQFQATVNAVALTLSLIAAFWTQFANPLTAVQLLWVNLIMDTMAALALATEPPNMSLLERNPYTKDTLLISQLMWRFIFGHAVYQLCALLVTLFMAESWKIVDDDPKNRNLNDQNKELLTLVFNVFVWLQIFNEINARRVQNEWNVFKGLWNNAYFVCILIITVGLQVLIVYFGGEFTSTVPLNWKGWVYSVVVGCGILFWNQIIRFIPVNLNDGILQVNKDELFKPDGFYPPVV